MGSYQIIPPGTPLPDGHPFKGTRLIFGMKPLVQPKKETEEPKSEKAEETKPKDGPDQSNQGESHSG